MKETIQIEVPKSATIIIDGVEYKPEYKPERKSVVWKPQYGESCFLLDADGKIGDWEYRGGDYIHEAYAQGNLSKSRSELEPVSKRRKLLKEFQDFIAEINAQEGWAADWRNSSQNKWHLAWNHQKNKPFISTKTFTTTTELSMYGCEKAITLALEKFKNDLKLIITGEA